MITIQGMKRAEYLIVMGTLFNTAPYSFQTYNPVRVTRLIILSYGFQKRKYFMGVV